MDNQEFDQIFSGRLQEEQDFDFRESDWKEIAPVLAARQRRGLAWWSWLLMGLLVFALLIIYGLATELTEAKEQVTNLQVESKFSQIEKVDTVFNKITITTYDTIVKTIFKENVVLEEKSNSSELKNISSSIGILGPIKEGVEKEKNQAKIESYENLESEQELELLLPLSLNVPLTSEKIKEETHFEPKRIYTKPRKSIYRKTLSLGFTNAWGLTENQTNSFYQRNSENSVKRFVFDLGLRAELAWNPNLRILATVAYNQVNLKTPFVLDSLIRGGIANGGFLDIAKVQQGAVHYELGLKYVFNNGKKWKPFGGLSVAYQSALRYRVVVTSAYSYQLDKTTNTNTIKRASFQFNSIRQFFGYEYQISDRLAWQVEQWYRFNFWKDRSQMYGAFGIRNTLVYRF